VERPDPSKIEAEYFDGLIAEHGEFNPFSDRGWRTLGRRFEQWVRCVQAGRSARRRLRHGAFAGNLHRALPVLHGRGFIRNGNRDGEAEIPAIAMVFGRCDGPAASGSELRCGGFSSVLHHIPDFLPALREGLRELRPGGQVFAYDPNLRHPGMALIRWPKSPLYNSNGVSPNERPLLPASFGALLALRDLWMCGSVARATFPAARLLSACRPIYNVCDWIMARTGIDRIFGTFVLTCGRGPER
jgi:SAM-dependent methyltransferase